MSKYPSQAKIKEVFEYYPETGLFKRLISRSNRGKLGSTTNGSKYCGGYRSIFMDGKNLYAHRVAWIYINGDIPNGLEIDHINGVRDDNRIVNLRLVTKSQNEHNYKTPRDNKSGLIGVSWNKAARKWVSGIVFKGKRFHLGSFDNKKDAFNAYLAAKAKFHPTQPIPRDINKMNEVLNAQ